MIEKRQRGPSRTGDTDDRGGDDELARALRQFAAALRGRMADIESGGAAFEPGELFASLRRSVGSMGMRARPAEIDDFGMDTSTLAAARPLLDFLADRYWRVAVHGAERLPAPALFVANRGGLLPYDGLILSHVLARQEPDRPRPRFLWTDGVESMPFVTPWLTRMGAVRAGRENAERLLRSGRSVIAFPEGASASQKSFADRYQVGSFGRGGIVRLAVEVGVPVVPVGIVGAEEVHPLLARVAATRGVSGLPFLPVTPTFPLLGLGGLLPLPVRWHLAFGEPLSWEATESAVVGDELWLARTTASLRRSVERLVQEALEARSQSEAG